MSSVIPARTGPPHQVTAGQAPPRLATHAPAVSVVVPMFNEADRVPELLRAIRRWQPPFDSAEILLVDDGSTDGTADLLRTGLAQTRTVPATVIGYELNRGKGAAVRYGVEHASGRFVCFLDADLSVDLAAVGKAISVMQHEGADVAFGSRRHPNTTIPEPQPLARRMSGQVFNLMVRTLGLSRWKDTQCGFKIFSSEAAAAAFPEVEAEGFAFDVELLLVAEELGFDVMPIPVEWRHRDGSKVSPLRDGWAMARSLWAIRARRQEIGKKSRAAA